MASVRSSERLAVRLVRVEADKIRRTLRETLRDILRSVANQTARSSLKYEDLAVSVRSSRLRSLAALFWAATGALLLSACGNALYAARVTQASRELARAEQLDAARRAPYDYYYALEHLQKARTEAGEADYGDAVALAEAAYQHANRAVQIAQRVAPAEGPLPLDPP